MEDIFADTFGLKFTSNIVFDSIHNTSAVEIKSIINENNKSKINFTYKEAEYLYVYNIEKYPQDFFVIFFAKHLISCKSVESLIVNAFVTNKVKKGTTMPSILHNVNVILLLIIFSFSFFCTFR